MARWCVTWVMDLYATWLGILGLVVGTVVATGAVFAHGGEDHGAEAAVPVVDAGMEVHRIEVVTSRSELVLRWPYADEGEPLRFEAFISDFETNVPVEGARVELRLEGPESVKMALQASGRGRYLADITSPKAGRYTMTMVVAVTDGGDVLVAEGLELGPHAPDERDAHEDPDHEHAALPWVFWAGLAGVLVVVLAAFAFLARRRARTAELVVVLCLALGGSSEATAHGGEDHDHGAATQVVANPGGSVELPKEAQNLLGVTTLRVERKTVTPRLTVTGMVTVPAGRDRTVVAPMTGTLEPAGLAAELALGQRVVAGQVLYVMTVLPDAGDRASLLAEQAREKASLSGHAARVKQAQRALTRARALNRQDQAIATREVEQAEAELAEARSRLDASRAAIAALSFEGEGSALRIDIKSPIGGEIAALNIVAGQVTADTQLLRVIDRSELLVSASIIETDLSRISLAGLAEVRTDAGLTTARHVFTGPLVDPVKRTVDVLYAVDQKADSPLWLNQFVTLALPSGLATIGLVVPESALVDIDGRPVVWVKRSAEVFQPIDVKIEARDGGLAKILGNLVVGDRVVVSGMAFLRGAKPAVTR